MPIISDLPTGKWWRYSGYVISKDGFIRPKRGAKLQEYDPWSSYAITTTNRKAKGDSCWERLINLVRKFLYEPRENIWLDKNGKPVTSSESAKDEIRAWVCDYGLLGVLPHMTQSFINPPWWISFDDGQAVQNDSRHRFGRVSFERFTKKSTGWEAVNFPIIYPLLDDAIVPVAGEPVYIGDQQAGMFEPTVTMATHLSSLRDQSCDPIPAETMGQSFEFYAVATQGIDDTWTEFFPSLKEPGIFQFPAPLTPEFFSIYSEPVAEFLDAASLLLGLVCFLHSLGDPKDRREQALAKKHLTRYSDYLLNDVALSVEPGPKKLHTVWRSTSLLGSMAAMMLRDATRQRELHRCLRCDQFFASSAYQVQYCSSRCRNAEQQQRHRDRIKIARTLRKKRVSLKKIVTEIKNELGYNASIQEVKHWVGEG